MAYIRKSKTATPKINKLPYRPSKPAEATAEPYRGGASLSKAKTATPKTSGAGKMMRKTATPIAQARATRAKLDLMEKKIDANFKKRK